MECAVLVLLQKRNENTDMYRVALEMYFGLDG